MYSFLIAIFAIICVLLTFVILIQSSKGGGLAGTFGGGADTFGSVFGGKGSAPFLQKITAILATLFLVIAIIMGMITRGNVSQSSLVQKEREQRLNSPARTLPQVPQGAVQGGETAPQPQSPSK